MSETVRETYDEVLRAMDTEAIAAARVAHPSEAVMGLLLVNDARSTSGDPVWRPTVFWPLTDTKLGSESSKITVNCPVFSTDLRGQLVETAAAEAHFTPELAESFVNKLMAKERSFLGFLSVGLGILTYHPEAKKQFQLRISSAKEITPKTIMSAQTSPDDIYLEWRGLIEPLGIPKAINLFPSYSESDDTVLTPVRIDKPPLELVSVNTVPVPKKQAFSWVNYPKPA